MVSLEFTLNDVAYTVVETRGSVRHWAERHSEVTLCSKRNPKPSVSSLYPDCAECSDAMQTLREDARRLELAALAFKWGIDIAGTRYGITGGSSCDHLLRAGDLTTLCGVGSTRVVAALDVTPTCRRCLKLVARKLEPTLENDRLQLVATLAADIVAQYSDVRIKHVPGDQVERLRTAIRKAMRKRNLNIETSVSNGMVFASSRDVSRHMDQAESNATMVEVLEHLDDEGFTHPTIHSRTLDWRTWAH